jgi:hypothetical protein
MDKQIEIMADELASVIVGEKQESDLTPRMQELLQLLK